MTGIVSVAVILNIHEFTFHMSGWNLQGGKEKYISIKNIGIKVIITKQHPSIKMKAKI